MKSGKTACIKILKRAFFRRPRTRTIVDLSAKFERLSPISLFKKLQAHCSKILLIDMPFLKGILAKRIRGVQCVLDLGLTGLSLHIRAPN